MSKRFQEYYEANPDMVSSPFGGVDGIHREMMLKIFELLDINLEGRRVLDVGCGRGFTGDVVAECGGFYLGADLVASRQGLRMVVADGTRLPFPDGAFDALFCIDAFEHIVDSLGAALEFHRLLRPGGFVFLSAPNYGNVAGLVKKYCETFGRYEKDTWAPFRNWRPQEFEQCITGRRVRRAFREGGFERLRVLGYPGEVDGGLLPWLAHPSMPECIKFRLQRLFAMIGPVVVRIWPGASLHLFWKIDRGNGPAQGKRGE
ncbi:MAG: class I SAM-dependent methyltransferase [Candidatus Hydrogenedentota bacterium]